MRKRTVCALMMTLCLLAACGGEAGTGNNTDEFALDIRADYLSMSGCTARMDVTADYGAGTRRYSPAREQRSPCGSMRAPMP